MARVSKKGHCVMGGGTDRMGVWCIGAGGSATRSVAHSHDVFEHALGENRELSRRIVRVLSGRARHVQEDEPHGPLFDFEGSSH